MEGRSSALSVGHGLVDDDDDGDDGDDDDDDYDVCKFTLHRRC